ncbi:MAG: Uma2 family endonuclease [Ferruginibacter sp.]|nr:Uma2 family endonuclease [Cytophagales bacterium]
MSAGPKPPLTEAEYLAVERKASYKSEFYRGEMFAMAGATRNHNALVSNLMGILNTRLRGKPCSIFPSDLRLHIPLTGLYTYPDAQVVCGKEAFVDNQFDTLTNPVIILEVLSESTEKYDRGEKFRLYRSIPSLREYVMVGSERVSIQRFALNEWGHWELTDASKPDETIRLKSVDCPLSLADVYDKVSMDH